MADKKTLANIFASDDGKRREGLQTARLCAALSKPWLLPLENQRKNSRLPENHQSVGSRGITNLEGRLLLALYPPSQPYFQLEISPDIRYDPNVPPEMIQEIQQQLFLRELTAIAVLESASIDEGRNRRRQGFRSRKRMALSQVLVTGDVLEFMDDDYRITVFRRDMYVTRRDSAGDVLYHVIKEEIDPLEVLTAGQQAQADLTQKIEDAATAADRLCDLYTMVEWNPVTGTWVIRQEVNNTTVNEREEKISPYFSTPFELAPQDDYGRGIIELNLGDLRSFDELRLRMKDFAALHSKQLIAIDENSSVNDSDLSRESGEPFRASVRNGVISDIAWTGPNNAANFQVVHATASEIRKDLGTAMLMELEAQPRGERVTAEQVRRVAMELEGALGGVYAPLSDEQQVPMLRRLMYQLERDKLIEPLSESDVQIKVLTGIAALERDLEASKVLTALQTIMQIPGAEQRVNMDVLVDVVMRFSGVYEPGLIKDAAQAKAEAQQQLQQMAAQSAAEEGGKQAAQVAGDVARAELTPQEQQ